MFELLTAEALSGRPDPRHPARRALARIAYAAAGTLLRSLSEEEAREVVYGLQARYGWAVASWNRADAEYELKCNTALTPDDPAFRTLSPQQWERVQTAPSWEALSDLAYRSAAEAGLLYEALIEAGVICRQCTVVLDEEPERTWGLCDEHRPSIAAVLAQPCHSAPYRRHERQAGRCAYCWVPMPRSA